MVQQKMEHDPALRIVRFAGCFGWLHTPSGGLSNGTAVVLCAGLSTDGLTGYRPLRLLATALAGAGYPTLRFDYPGTGNSSDADLDEVWQLWQASIHAAVEWLRSQNIAERFVLCGLRAGATLAMEVSASRHDIAGLLLLEPVLRGRSYLRQLSIEAAGNAMNSACAGPLKVHELSLSARTVQRVSEIDLRRFEPARSCRIGVFAQTQTKLLSECIAAWSSTGVTVDSGDFAGLEAMLRPVLMSHMASIDATSILAWMSSFLPVTSVSSALEPLPAEDALVQNAFMETALRFGPRQALFGILCEPARRSTANIAVIITNSSGNPSYGFGRFGVELARDLAAVGIASLRMDFTGLGDSISHNDAPTHIFEADRREEIRSAVDLLVTRGYCRVAIQGLCSGAYHALHAAFVDPRVEALVLVNLQHFFWAEGYRVELEGYALRHPIHFLTRLGSRTAWVNLLRGKLDLAGIVAVQVARLSDRFRRSKPGFGLRLGKETRKPATVIDHMQILSPRTKTLFLMSEGDEGIDVLSREFGAALEPPGAVVQIVPDLDHALSSMAMRRVAIDHIITFLETNMRPGQPAARALSEMSTV